MFCNYTWTYIKTIFPFKVKQKESCIGFETLFCHQHMHYWIQLSLCRSNKSIKWKWKQAIPLAKVRCTFKENDVTISFFLFNFYKSLTSSCSYDCSATEQLNSKDRTIINKNDWKFFTLCDVYHSIIITNIFWSSW